MNKSADKASADTTPVQRRELTPERAAAIRKEGVEILNDILVDLQTASDALSRIGTKPSFKKFHRFSPMAVDAFLGEVKKSNNIAGGLLRSLTAYKYELENPEQLEE